MRTTARAVVVVAGALLTFVVSGGSVMLAQTAAPAPAQPSVSDDTQGDITGEIELTRAAIQVRRQALVTAAMDLEPKEASAFWPLYREYRTAMANVNDRFVKLVVAFLNQYDALSDDAAIKMLNEYLSIERARTGVKTTYVPRFEKVLPAKKVARFFQVDNKLDAVVNAELAHLIPLAR